MKQALTNSRVVILMTLIGLLSSLGIVTLVLNGRTQAEEDGGAVADQGASLPTTITEARARARLLHETIHGALQVAHRDFFDAENPLAIPSSSLEDVFDELARSHHVDVKWLIVETDILNVDHKPQNDFEKQATRALSSGKPEFESSDDHTYRYAGSIRLASQCLKCHVKTRTNTETRTAGLIISMPLCAP